jgi:hypothetical protein
VHVGRHDDGQQRILQRILLENVGEAGADHGAEAELRERPRGVLAGAAAAEVIAGQQNLRAFAARRVEDEVGFLPIGIVAPVVEELLVEPFLRDGLQKARGDDLIGIDVVDQERNEARFEWERASYRMSSRR